MVAQTRMFCQEISNVLDAIAHDELLIPEVKNRHKKEILRIKHFNANTLGERLNNASMLLS